MSAIPPKVLLIAAAALTSPLPAVAQDRPAPPVIVPAPPPPPWRPPTPRVSMITNPAWARQPVPEYPERALERGVEGRARLECIALPSGFLGDCRVVHEDPAGMGFGAAALAAADMARLTPRTIDGAATGARVTFNVDFRLPPPPPVPIKGQ